MKYPVNDIYTCIQGEGVQSGVAMVLLRLHGCAVGCPWCDTKETWAFKRDLLQKSIPAALGVNGCYAWADSETIADHIKAEHSGPNWVLVTGGEPSQYDLRALVTALHAAGYKVALETSGTENGHLDARFDWVCVSPKIDMPGGKKIRHEVFASADEIKHVVGKAADITLFDDLLATVKPKASTTICLQPISQSDKATKLCIDTVQQRGWRLSIQTHKYLGVA